MCMSSSIFSTLSVCNSLLFRVEEFQYRGHLHHFHLWEDLKEHKSYEEYKIYKSRPSDDLLIYELRKNQWRSLVTVHFVSLKEDCGFKHLRVFTQRIPLRLHDINSFTLEEGIYVLQEALIGFALITHNFGVVEVTDRMICVNEEGRVKVWLNQQYARNDIAKADTDEEKMVNKIFLIVGAKIVGGQKLQQFKRRKEGKMEAVRFISSIKFVMEWAQDNLSKQVTRLGKLRLRAKDNSPTLRLTFSKKPTARSKDGKLRWESIHKLTSPLKYNSSTPKTNNVRYFTSSCESSIRQRSKSNVADKFSFKAKTNSKDLTSSLGPNTISPTRNLPTIPLEKTKQTVSKLTLNTNVSLTNPEDKESFSPRSRESPMEPYLGKFLQFSPRRLTSPRTIKMSLAEQVEKNTSLKSQRNKVSPRGSLLNNLNNLSHLNNLSNLNNLNNLKKSAVVRRTSCQQSPFEEPSKYGPTLCRSILEITIPQIEENPEQDRD